MLALCFRHSESQSCQSSLNRHLLTHRRFEIAPLRIHRSISSFLLIQFVNFTTPLSLDIAPFRSFLFSRFGIRSPLILDVFFTISDWLQIVIHFHGKLLNFSQTKEAVLVLRCLEILNTGLWFWSNSEDPWKRLKAREKRPHRVKGEYWAAL